jgi:S1-C subfamily serine protease
MIKMIKLIKNLCVLALIFLISFFIFFNLSSAQETADGRGPASLVGEAEFASLSKVESKVRTAAVKVIAPSGSHGSGTYVKINGFNIILTARHVADELGVYIIKSESEEVSGIVVYREPDADIAAILIDDLKSRRPMAFRPTDNIAEVGESTIYSGYPSSHALLTFRGMVVGHASHGSLGRSIIVHTFGWFGCSGSGVYNQSGELLGILWGVDAQASPFGPQIIEDVLWIAPANEINIEYIMTGVCSIRLGAPECSDYFDKISE